MSENGGEKELILGNRQLISLFFIVVALCGVFFAMGYMVRGNSLKGAVSTTGDPIINTSETTVRRQQPEPPRESEVVPPEPTTQVAPQASVMTHPAQDTAPPASGASAQTATADSKPEIPEVGATYVQVGALSLTDAETTVRALREQHLPASIAPSSKENLYRVLVGPYHQTSDVADAKSRLKTLGFSDTIVQKQ